MKKILLVHPSRKVLGNADNLFTNESLVPSLGLASIAAYCRERGIETKIIDLRLPQRTVKEITDWIEKNQPVLVGITAFTAEITAANIIAGIIKKKFAGLPVIVGGPHSSVIPKETLREFSNFDLAVIGEGEKIIVQLADLYLQGKKEDLKNVQGIVFRSEQGIMLNRPGEPIADLNSLPFPAWDAFELKYYRRIFPVSASRGCPYRCYFCTPDYLGNRVRIRRYQKVVEEIEWLVENFSAERIQFADATLSQLKENALPLCEELIRKGLNRKIKWDCETRADSVNLQLLKKMKEAGCEWIALGVETGDEQILKNIVKKGETKEQIRIAVRLARQAGIKVRCFFILGHYTETAESIKKTIDFALELNPDALSFGLMVPNPGSEIRRLAEQDKSGLRIRHNHWENYQQFNYDCLESTNIPLDELKKWQANAYFTFYLHHPLKALAMFFDRSAYNYRISGLLKIPFVLLRNKLE